MADDDRFAWEEGDYTIIGPDNNEPVPTKKTGEHPARQDEDDGGKRGE